MLTAGSAQVPFIQLSVPPLSYVCIYAEPIMLIVLLLIIPRFYSLTCVWCYRKFLQHVSAFI